MIRKRYLVFLSTIVLTTMFFSSFGSAAPAVIISSYSLSPEVLFPGDTAVLTLSIKNMESAATQTSVSVSGSESTTTVRTLSATLNNIWIVAAGSTGKQIKAVSNYEDICKLAPLASIDVEFKLTADSGISEGLYFPIARIAVEEGGDVQFPIPVKVSNATVELTASEVPSKISAGGSTEITLTVINRRDAAVDEVIVSASDINEIALTPESVFVGSLNAHASEDVVVSLRPNETGEFNLSFAVDYKNGDNVHTSTLTIPVEVVSTLDVAPIITNYPYSITKGSSSRINIEVYNAKTETITGVLVTPICDATVIPSQYFIGSMDPDDVFSASFDIYTDTIDYGNYTIGFLVTFKQGNEYYETPMASKIFHVISGPGISYQNSGSTSSSSTSNGMPQTPSLAMCLTPLILLVVVILVSYFVYRQWKKRRKV